MSENVKHQELTLADIAARMRPFYSVNNKSSVGQGYCAVFDNLLLVNRQHEVEGWRKVSLFALRHHLGIVRVVGNKRNNTAERRVSIAHIAQQSVGSCLHRSNSVAVNTVCGGIGVKRIY